MNTLIDWNIYCDIYASLCVIKYCVFAVGKDVGGGRVGVFFFRSYPTADI